MSSPKQFTYHNLIDYNEFTATNLCQISISVCVRLIILLSSFPGSSTAQDLKSSSDPQSPPDDGGLDGHLAQNTEVSFTQLYSL